MALYRWCTKVSWIGRVPWTEYMTQDTYDALPSSKLTDNVNRGIYTDSEDTTLEKFIKNWVEYCLGWGGEKIWTLELLVVWWWGWWSWVTNGVLAWWGWAWWLIYCPSYSTQSNTYNITIWKWWSIASPWTNSCFWWLVAYWGGRWSSYSYYCQACLSWWSGWWGVVGGCWWLWCSWQWYNWWCWCTWWAWWWGWAWEAWGNATTTTSWNWWNWCCLDISWEYCWYAWWWAGWKQYNCTQWVWWCWCDYCWWWGRWAGCGGWYTEWKDWIVIVRYKTSWSHIAWANWWTKYVCWDYTIHCFTANWTFEVFTG